VKQPVILLFICFCIACSSTKNTGMKPNQLNGTWVPIKQEMGRTPLPHALYETHKLFLNDTSYTFYAESVDKGSVK
jgi:hypothetical protein